MVLLQPEHQEESVCVLLVNGLAVCSQEEPLGDKSKPPLSQRSLYQILFSPRQAHFMSFKKNSARQSMRKLTAEKSHKSSRLSFRIFNAECSLWI